MSTEIEKPQTALKITTTWAIALKCIDNECSMSKKIQIIQMEIC